MNTTKEHHFDRYMVSESLETDTPWRFSVWLDGDPVGPRFKSLDSAIVFAISVKRLGDDEGVIAAKLFERMTLESVE